MADYTLKNLKDVEDAAPGFGLSPELEARFAREPLELENMGISYQRLAPDFRGFGHRHKTQEEIYVLISGSARARVEAEVVELKPFDALRVHKDTMRGFEAGPEGAELIAIGAPNTGPGDGDTVQGWWSD